jgi:hypothetical protein
VRTTLCNGCGYYDTDTAKPLVSSDNEWSEAGWCLFQAPDGAYFKVVYGHEGEEIGFSMIPHYCVNELIAKATHKVTRSSSWPRQS